MLCEDTTRGFLGKSQSENLLRRVLEITHAPSDIHSRIKHLISIFMSNIRKRWANANRH